MHEISHAAEPTQNRAVDKVYVDGVSITYYFNLCKNLWSYMGVCLKRLTLFIVRCVLVVHNIRHNNYSPLTFICNDYYCESRNLMIQFETVTGVVSKKQLVVTVYQCIISFILQSKMMTVQFFKPFKYSRIHCETRMVVLVCLRLCTVKKIDI